MRVRCVSCRGESLAASSLGKPWGLARDDEYPLEVGKEYAVYALAADSSGVWYFVMDEDDLWYPQRYAASLFELSDRRVSRHWRLCVSRDDGSALFAPERWAADKDFYNNLTDGREAEVAQFAQDRAAMDADTQPA
jgi:hypothetical protein